MSFDFCVLCNYEDAIIHNEYLELCAKRKGILPINSLDELEIIEILDDIDTELYRKWYTDFWAAVFGSEK